MLARLNLETQAYHAAADEGWRSLLSTDISKFRYVQQLKLAYGFEGPLEAALAYTPSLDGIINVHERYRAGYIAQDLIALGMRPGEVARLPQQTIAPFANPLEALGWMYVADRGTPLFDEVRRYLAVRLPDAREACVYLSANDGHVSARWQALGQALDRAARSPRMADEIIAAAHAGFRAWLDWSQHRGASLGVVV
jgi:heme oxygenase